MSINQNNTPGNEWPKAGQFRKSIRFEFSLYVSGIILALMLATGYIMTDRYEKTVTRGVADKLLVQIRSYSGSAGKLIISTNGPDVLLLNNICKKLTEDNADIYWVGIADQTHKFLAHTDFKQVISGDSMTPVSGNRYNDMLFEGEAFEIRNDTIYISAPIREGDVVVGSLGAASSTAQISRARSASIVTMVSITILMILIGIPVTMVVLHRKLAPISIITDTLKNVSYDDINIEIPLKSRNEFGYLAETLHVMGHKLSTARKDFIEKERINRELEIARDIQANILPSNYPRHSSYNFWGAYRSAKLVGGDYYDFIDFDEHHLAFLVADVSGKSLPGMLVMLLTRDIVKKYSLQVRRPDEVLCEVNRELLPSIKRGMFVTMFFGLLDKRNGLFKYASAGHNPLIRIDGRSGKAELLKTKGFPLGMVTPEKFNERIECAEIRLEPNDWLIQYTDGINEAVNRGGEEFGMKRFISLLENTRAADASDLINKIIAEYEQFTSNSEQFDDITLLAMKWTGNSDDRENNKTKDLSNVSQN